MNSSHVQCQEEKEDQMITQNLMFLKHLQQKRSPVPRQPSIRVRYPSSSNTSTRSAVRPPLLLTTPPPPRSSIMASTPVMPAPRGLTASQLPRMQSLASQSFSYEMHEEEEEGEEEEEDEEEERSLYDGGEIHHDEHVEPSLSLPDAQNSVQRDIHAALIDIIQEYSCIWRVKSKEYKDRDRKERSWNEIAERLGISDGKKLTDY